MAYWNGVDASDSIIKKRASQIRNGNRTTVTNPSGYKNRADGRVQSFNLRRRTEEQEHTREGLHHVTMKYKEMVILIMLATLLNSSHGANNRPNGRRPSKSLGSSPNKKWTAGGVKRPASTTTLENKGRWKRPRLGQSSSAPNSPTGWKGSPGVDSSHTGPSLSASTWPGTSTGPIGLGASNFPGIAPLPNIPRPMGPSGSARPQHGSLGPPVPGPSRPPVSPWGPASPQHSPPYILPHTPPYSGFGSPIPGSSHFPHFQSSSPYRRPGAGPSSVYTPPGSPAQILPHSSPSGSITGSDSSGRPTWDQPQGSPHLSRPGSPIPGPSWVNSQNRPDFSQYHNQPTSPLAGPSPNTTPTQHQSYPPSPSSSDDSVIIQQIFPPNQNHQFLPSNYTQYSNLFEQ